ncbi:hypothetical protein PGT21_000248 [Puccinia graminis f. sp. tritici]|uniref:Uncharacterized protein n=1 Tax=Puccinia graminis f. sp. tritici TaxID=56615 RepID=A0A5B0QE33_PUCGR|nr:hypothetical protein PGT21_000248 [Puccinia graminis f. sp. tritici]
MTRHSPHLKNTISITLQACLQPFVSVIYHPISLFKLQRSSSLQFGTTTQMFSLKFRHFTSQISPNSPFAGPPPTLSASLRQCRTNLKSHQLSALSFLLRNEHPNNNTKDLWYHDDTPGFRHYFDKRFCV